MGYLEKRYIKSCEFLLTQHKFNLYKNNFYRVVNDIFQSFRLHKSISNNECTVEFTVIPLCVGNRINKTFCGVDHLKMFENDYSWFTYDRQNTNNMDQCVDLMIKYTKQYLIPFFEKTNNAKDAYFEICDFQEKHYKKWVLAGDYSLFCMALKSGLYERALEHLKAKKSKGVSWGRYY